MQNIRHRATLEHRYEVECFSFHHLNGDVCQHHGNQLECGQGHHVRQLKWRETFKNIVVGTGLDAILNNTFNAVAGSVAWYVGLIGAGTGTVSITSGAAAVTGSGTSFANGDNGSDLIIVGAGAAGADLITTVSGNPGSTTALTAGNNAGTTVAGAAYALEPRAADTMSSKSFNETAPYSNSVRPTWTKNGASSGGSMSNSSSPASFNINTSGRVFGAFLSSDSTKSGTAGSLFGGGLFTSGAGSRAVANTDVVNVTTTLTATSA